MAVAFLTSSILSGVASPTTLAARAGPGKGMRLYTETGRPSALATFRTPSLRSCRTAR